MATITGVAFGDTIFGTIGPDTLFSAFGDNILDTAQGIATFDISSSAGTFSQEPIIPSLMSLSQPSVGIVGNLETVVGSPFTTIAVSGAEANIILGGAGDDVLVGLGGADVLTGGFGADAFAFFSPADAGDTITDFQSGVDVIVLDRTGFGLPQSQSLDSNNWFILGQDGTLILDTDGSGPNTPLVLATFTAGVPLISDIFLI